MAGLDRARGGARRLAFSLGGRVAGRRSSGDGAAQDIWQLGLGRERLVVEAQRGCEKQLLWLGDAAKCRSNVLVIQVQPGKSCESFGALVFQAFASSFGIFSIVGVEDCNDVGVIRWERDG